MEIEDAAERAPGRPVDRGRGRPRPKETIQLDHDVLKELTAHGPSTRNDIAAALGANPRLVYLALRRLRVEGRVRKCAGEGAYTIWSASEHCP